MSVITCLVDTGSQNHAIATDVLFSHLAQALEGHVSRGEVLLIILPDGSIEDGDGELLYEPKRRNRQQSKKSLQLELL